MIVGVGIDSVEIARFKRWLSFSERQLLRVFSERELSYCRQHSVLTPQRFAVRFAAKEAFLKAYAGATGDKISLLKICAAVAVISDYRGAPILQVDWKLLGQRGQLQALISMTHTHSVATAVVILQKS